SRGTRLDPSGVKSSIDDRLLDILDSHRPVIYAEDARAFARRGTNAAGEFGKIVLPHRQLESFLPTVVVDQIIPLWNQVVYGTARRRAVDQISRMAERAAAIHAASRLKPQLIFTRVKMELFPVTQAFAWRSEKGNRTLVFHESGWFSHKC